MILTLEHVTRGHKACPDDHTRTTTCLHALRLWYAISFRESIALGFKYLGLHFHQSGSIAHLVTPIKSKAGGSWAAVQRRHSLLQCGNTINLHLHLLQAILVPVLQYGCQIWGMHSPRVAAADDARAALQRLNDYCSGPFAVFYHPLLAGFC